MTRRNELRWVVFLGAAALVVLLNILPNQFPIISRLFVWLDAVDYGDKIGHVALFALLALTAYVALSGWLSDRRALAVAAGGTMLLGTLTELYQKFVAGRSPSLKDLGANWLGVLAVTLLIVTVAMLKSRYAHQRVTHGT